MPDVEDNPALDRFETRRGGAVAFVEYRRDRRAIGRAGLRGVHVVQDE